MFGCSGVECEYIQELRIHWNKSQPAVSFKFCLHIKFEKEAASPDHDLCVFLHIKVEKEAVSPDHDLYVTFDPWPPVTSG